MTQDITKKYNNIRKKNFFVELLPFIGGGTSTAIYPNVYLSRKVYKSVYSKDPDPYRISTLLHEEEHIRRIEQKGVLKWYFLYMVDRHFRFEEELQATVVQLAYIKDLGLTIDLEKRAHALSGILYLWQISYKKALEKLTDSWDNL